MRKPRATPDYHRCRWDILPWCWLRYVVERVKLQSRKKISIQVNMLAEDCFVPIARVLFVHLEKLMVRICSCTFDMFHTFIINLMWLNFVIFYLGTPSVCDSFWLLGTKVSCNITPILLCPRFPFIQISCIMNFVQIPDKVPYVTKLVKVCAAPCGTSKINFSHIWPLCRWNIIHALDFLSGVKQNLTFIPYNCICIFVLYMVQ